MTEYIKKLKLTFVFLFCFGPGLGQTLPPIGVVDGKQYYVPPPIVLIHGFASSEATWNTVYNNYILNWFLNGGVYSGQSSLKYNYNNNFINTGLSTSKAMGSNSYTLYPFAPLFDYSPTNNGDINANGNLLYNFLSNSQTGVLSSTGGAYVPGYTTLSDKANVAPSSAGVFLFGHSMGGLLMRSALAQPGLSNGIWGIGTVGTPNLGSYLGSVVILFNEISPQLTSASNTLKDTINSTDPDEQLYSDSNSENQEVSNLLSTITSVQWLAGLKNMITSLPAASELAMTCPHFLHH